MYRYFKIVLYNPLNFAQKDNEKYLKIGLSMQLLIADERKNKNKLI